ncbi:MAG TPA: hypothetical protein PLD54_03600 [Candidatus Levybacteria bacterium]|nr:hypothetical protein [Candidatus Levybacteria bacterium]
MKKATNSRILPARLPQILGGSALIVTLSLTVALSMLLTNVYSLYQQEIAEKNSVTEKYTYWQGIIEQYPHFPAAYYEAAVYAAQLENIQQAKSFLQKALVIDPNFFEAETLAKELEEK